VMWQKTHRDGLRSAGGVCAEKLEHLFRILPAQQVQAA
jgi:hypothetical protein